MSKRGAVIEIGTNSVKFLIADVLEDGIPGIIVHDRVITRLGEGICGSGNICPDALRRTISAVAEYKAAAEEKGAGEIKIVGTHALRAAKNAPIFTGEVKKITGIDVEILSGEEEAAAAMNGALQNRLPKRGAFAVIDIGGGSAEIASNSGIASVPVGAAGITESFLFGNPPEKSEILSAENHIKSAFLEKINFIPDSEQLEAVGVGGTVAATAALILGLEKYEPERIHNFEIEKDNIKKVFTKLSMMKTFEIKSAMPFDPDRADILLGGIIILKTFFESFRISRFSASVNGNIHGIFRRYFINEKKGLQ